jgi:hypothetical protein
LYIGLIHCYIALKDYESAKAATQLALQEWPYEDELVKLNQNINVFLDHQIKENEVQLLVSKLEQELNEQKEKHKREINEVREWALNLIKLQNRYTKNEETILESEEDWRVILKEMHNIAIAMINAQENKVEIQEIKSKFKQKYPKLSQDGLEFLTTGEYLYQIHKDNEIDFAPVMVEFSKVIETELNHLLRKQKLINSKQNLTLGQINHNLTKIKIANLPDITNFLDQLVFYRNGSAHTGQSTREKVEKVRKMILEDGWLELILDNL